MNFGQWLGLVVLVVSLYILWEVRQLLLLLFVAVVFATALNRLIKWLESKGVQRGLATAVSVIGILGLLGLFAVLIVPSFLDQLQQLSQLIPQGLNQLQRWQNELLTRIPGQAMRYVPGTDDLVGQIQPLAQQLANNVFRLFSGFLNVTISLLLVLVVTIMLAINPQAYRQLFVRLFPSFYRRRAEEILTYCEVDLVNWILGTLFNMLVIGTISGIVLWILGVPLVLANALLAGLLEAVPNVGPVLSTLPPTVIALIDSPQKSILVVIAYILIQQLEQYFLVPLVMGQQLSLLPAVTLLAQLVFASFFGFLGLFLALPLLIIVRVLLREILVRDVLDRWQNLASPDDPENLAPKHPVAVVAAPSPTTPSPAAAPVDLPREETPEQP